MSREGRGTTCELGEEVSFVDDRLVTKFEFQFKYLRVPLWTIKDVFFSCKGYMFHCIRILFDVI